MLLKRLLASSNFELTKMQQKASNFIRGFLLHVLITNNLKLS